MTWRFPRPILPATLLSLLLAACGGSGDSNAPATSATPAATTQQPVSSQPAAAAASGAPVATGETATDGLNWFNYRRQQVGIATFVRNSTIDIAAQGHSNYQKLNNTITHTQTAGNAGFTGVTPGNRISAAGYNGGLSAYGEVISSTSSTSGFGAAEDLVTAIYHRFVILEPVFRLAGTGSATSSGGTTYFTTDFIATNLSGGLGNGKFVVYPVAGQAGVSRSFFSDNEVPDPVPGKNEVGYPVSVHADITSTVNVGTFTIQPRGGSPLQTKLLSHSTDIETPASAAALIPLNPLSSNTTYDVSFTGTVDGVAVSRNWSFSTQ
ncbi:CAP domain-containing protein [Oxalobacteraceae bacterium OM1]|nr:CAP domain-containing protein [Oxalobacteraceae bacterium OM1]